MSIRFADVESQRRKRVTLIAAWKTIDGIVLLADSQETVGDYRVTVAKAKPEKMDCFEVIVAGAGQPGPLIDSYAPRLKNRLEKARSAKSMADFEAIAEEELIRFYDQDVKACSDSNKGVDFVVIAANRDAREYGGWRTQNVRLVPLDSGQPLILGWDEPLYKYIAGRFTFPDASIAQAVIAGVYLFGIAESTSNYVKSPFTVAVANEDGIWIDPQDYIQLLVERLRSYEEKVYQLFLACADTSVKPDQLTEKLAGFSEYVSDLHLKQITTVIEEFFVAGRKQGQTETKHPYLRTPEGTQFYFSRKGDAIVSFDEQKSLADKPHKSKKRPC